ncbi:hypothetical protein BJX61DRAFT_550312 [Aspergillus egyptiacus]|nr:hypothetical protein BJX61DRAFT_550312 [Aspergillus egyptiacus]
MAMPPSRLAGLVALALALGTVEGRPRYFLKDATPNLPADPNTISTCTWWWDNVDGAIPCEDMPFEWGISMEDFLRWNPSITADCGNYLTGRSYCVEAPAGGNEPPPTTTTTSTEPTPTDGNGVETPLPTQPGMVDDCDSFYYVEVGDSCAAIAADSSITTAQLVEWNPSIGSDCTGLWADTYVCPGMVDDCDEFYFVEVGDSCAAIASEHGISQSQFRDWNPSVGTDCAGLWANNYVCVSVVGHSPGTTTTTTTRPSPTQSGLIKTCTSFYQAQPGDTCQTIARQKYPYINSLPLFTRWNPAVGSNCNGLLDGYYHCVATELHQPMPGIIDTCKRYHQVKAGDSCWSIQQQYGITAAQFNRWNPLVGSSCGSLWERYFVCTGV